MELGSYVTGWRDLLSQLMLFCARYEHSVGLRMFAAMRRKLREHRVRRCSRSNMCGQGRLVWVPLSQQAIDLADGICHCHFCKPKDLVDIICWCSMLLQSNAVSGRRKIHQGVEM